MTMPFSKTSHIDIIEQIAKGMQEAGMNQRYLELGISKAKCFNRVAPYFEFSHAVDISRKSFDYIKENSFIVTFEYTTDEYFSFHKNNMLYKCIYFDMIFIDACHKYENVLNDFINSYSVIKPGGIIILHDTFSPCKEYDEHCQDAYKIRDYLKNNNFEAVTLPFYFGLTIVRK